MAAAQVRQRVGEGVMINVLPTRYRKRWTLWRTAQTTAALARCSPPHQDGRERDARQTLLDICNAVDVPVVASGGIHKENILQLKGTGVDGVALVSAIFAAKDIEAECRELRALSEQIIK